MKKQLPVSAAEINDAHQCAQESAANAVEHAIRCGELLLAKQDQLGHGGFHAWIEGNCDFALSTAKRYIAAAKKKATGVAVPSLSGIFPSGQPGAKPKTNTSRGAVSVVNPEGGRTTAAKEGTEETGADRPAAPASKQRTPFADDKVATAPPKAADVTSPPDLDFTGYEPEDDDAYRQNIENVMMADDKLAAMREELKQVRRELQAVKASRDHYQSEAGAAARLVKQRDREIEKLRKQLDARAAA